MVEILLTALAGGGTGLLGSLIGRVAGYFEQRQKLKHLEVELTHELKLHTLQQRARQEEREHEYAVQADLQATTQLSASYAHDSRYNNSILRWVRPALTLVLLVLSGLVYFTIADTEVKASLAMQIIYFTGLAITWWFADRSGRRN